MRVLTLLLVALMLAALAPAADAVERCVPLKDGSRVCVDLVGACASVSYVPPFTDFGAGASHCPSATVGPSGVEACDEVVAGYVTIAGFQGVAALACVQEYEDAGRLCVLPSVGSNHVDVRDFRPACVALP